MISESYLRLDEAGVSVLVVREQSANRPLTGNHRPWPFHLPSGDAGAG